MPAKRFPRVQQDTVLGLLQRIRRDSGLTQVQLARKLGQPQSYVSKYESGERRLDILELRQLCGAVGITLQDFAERLEQGLTTRRGRE